MLLCWQISGCFKIYNFKVFKFKHRKNYSYKLQYKLLKQFNLIHFKCKIISQCQSLVGKGR